jgi:hypothetical protein
MAAIGAYLAQLLLNASLKQTASFVSPATLGVGLSLGAPTSVSMSEIGSLSGYTPASLTMSSVGAAGTIASNAASVTFGPFSSAQSISGVVVKDTLALGGASGNVGNLHYFGLLATARTVGVGDTLVMAAAALTISLA